MFGVSQHRRYCVVRISQSHDCKRMFGVSQHRRLKDEKMLKNVFARMSEKCRNLRLAAKVVEA